MVTGLSGRTEHVAVDMILSELQLWQPETALQDSCTRNGKDRAHCSVISISYGMLVLPYGEKICRREAQLYWNAPALEMLMA